MGIIPRDPKETGSRTLKAALNMIGLDINKDIYWSYSLRCSPFKNNNKSIDNRHLEICKHNLENDLANTDAEIILAFGFSPVYQLLGHKDIMRARMGVHEVTIGKKTRKVIFTLNPQLVDKLSAWEVDDDLKPTTRIVPTGSAPWFFAQDINKLRDLITNGRIPDCTPNTGETE